MLTLSTMMLLSASCDYSNKSQSVPSATNPTTTPSPQPKGAFHTGVYRNVFVEEQVATDSSVSKRLEDLWAAFLANRFVAAGTDMGYIHAGDNFVLTEGQSYGMMICVQTNHKEEFDKLWKWAKTYMYHPSGEYKGYFAWKVKTDGSHFDKGPAPDGELYFAMSLFFAAARWGNGTGIFNYQAEANAILNAMLHQADDGEGANMIDIVERQIKFTPYTRFTDPSYHLPGFYDYFAQYADADKGIWHHLALKSRSMWLKFSNDKGLSPSYATYEGAPYAGFGDYGPRYSADAWRTIMNAAFDYAWWAEGEDAKTYANNLVNYFGKKLEDGEPRVGAYYVSLNMDGTYINSKYESSAAYATHATAALALGKGTSPNARKMVQKFWDTPVSSEYYGQLIYHLAYLHCSGNFKAYKLKTNS